MSLPFKKCSRCKVSIPLLGRFVLGWPKRRITGRNIIVIGTSAGGREALDDLIGQLPTDLPAPIFLVQHMAPENTGETLVHRLSRQKAFGCALATDGAPFETRANLHRTAGHTR